MPESNQASLLTRTGQSLQRIMTAPGPAALLRAAHRMRMAILALACSIHRSLFPGWDGHQDDLLVLAVPREYIL